MVYFKQSDFYSLESPNASQCAGNAKVFRDPRHSLAEGIAAPFAASSSVAGETLRPAFLVSVSVDLTDTTEESSVGVYRYPANACANKGGSYPGPSLCAYFDTDANRVLTGQKGAALGTGYYSMNHLNCDGAGPVLAYPNYYAGGVDIDLDRTEMASNAQMLLTMNWFPMDFANPRPLVTGSTAPASRSPDEVAEFQIHLVETEETLDSLQRIFQPRYFSSFLNSARFPIRAKSYALLSRAKAQMTDQQVLLNFGGTTSNRIRIERIKGDAILGSIRLDLLEGR